MTINYPEITAIIPAYNEEKTIKNCLTSVTEQNYPRKIKIIVMDDNSGDNTKRIAETFKGVKVITNEKNIGLAKNVNKGISLAKTELIFVLHADCALGTRIWLKRAVEFMLENSKSGVVSSNFVQTKKISSKESPWNKLLYANKELKKEEIVERKTNAINGISDLYRKRMWEKINGMDSEKFRVAGEDRDLSIRIKQAGYEMHLLPLRLFRYHGSNELGLKKYYKKRMQYAEANGALKRIYKDYINLKKWNPITNLLVWIGLMISAPLILLNRLFVLPTILLLGILITVSMIFTYKSFKTSKNYRILLVPFIKTTSDILASLAYVRGYITKTQRL